MLCYVMLCYVMLCMYVYIQDYHNPINQAFFFRGAGSNFHGSPRPIGPIGPSGTARGQLLFCRCGVLDGAACRSCSTKETLRSSSRHEFLGRRDVKTTAHANSQIAKLGISWEKLLVISGRKHEWKQQMRRELAIMTHGRHYERIGLTVI